MPTKKLAPTAKPPSMQPARLKKAEPRTTGKAQETASKAGRPGKGASKPAQAASQPSEEVSKPVEAAGKPPGEASKPAREAGKRAEGARKATARTPAAPASAPERAYTLEGLVARLGEASEAEVQRLLLTPAEELVALGVTVAAERIDADSARLYGLAADFYLQATPAQRQALLGLSADLLRVGAWAAQRGSELARTRRSELAALVIDNEDAVAAAEAMLRRARGRREQLRAALLLCAGNLPSRRSEVLGAYSLVGERGEALGESLRRLARLARSYLDSRDPNLKARAVATGLSVPLLNDTFALAGRTDELRTSGPAPRPAVSVPAREIARWDGINLTLLTHLLDVFDAARLIDPSIPRLLPMSLRGLFSPVSRGVKKRPEEGSGPA